MTRAFLLLGLVACAEPLREDVEGFETLGYQAWKRIEVHGDAPGHTGFRIIYASPEATAATLTLEGGYPVGARLVKEVFDDDGGVRGKLRHVAVMRRLDGYDDDGGWYFTEAKAGGPEEHYDFCFRRCHAAAPYNGAWLDYRD